MGCQLGYMPTAYARICACCESDILRFAAGTAEEITWQQLQP